MGMSVVELAELAKTIAPELRSAPLYVVDADSSGLPAEFMLYGCHGLYSPWFDVGLSSWLRDRGEWRGRGPAVLLNTGSLRREAADDAGGDQALADELYPGRLLATFVHEVAHVLELPADRTEYVDLRAASREATAALRTYHVTDCEPSAPWIGHDATWVRLLCHVVYRVETLTGLPLPGPWLCDPHRYRLSLFGNYQFTLADEPERLQDQTFETIKAGAPPAEFISLWRSDVLAWYRGLNEPGPEATKAVADGMALFSRS